MLIDPFHDIYVSSNDCVMICEKQQETKEKRVYFI